MLAGVFAVAGAARGDDRDRVDRARYEAAVLAAQQTFAGSYERVARWGRTGPGFDGVTFTAQTSLRSAADRLDRVALRTKASTACTKRSSPASTSSPTGSRRSRRGPLGADPAAVLAEVEGLQAIRDALLELRAAGYPVDPGAWQLGV